ncbi:MAG TPA: thermonuclease family protein [Azospirillum sp.]|nr:thermonuclease family protein [Azospirillum sp.]
MRRRLCFEVALAALLLTLPAHAATVQGKTSAVPNTLLKGRGMAIEGDLLSINGTPVRLMGVDAPDVGQMCKNRYGHELDCFTIARDVLKNLIENEEVECTVADQDRNGQKQGECRVRGVDLGGAMVARGWAFTYRSLTGAYQKTEAYAMSKRMGLWAGQVEKPWQWRTRRLREQAR